MAYSGSAQDRLDAVRTAIGECLSSQALTSTSGSHQMARLAELRAMEKELQQEVAMEANGGSMASLGYQSDIR